ncbi:MAG: hypothetical protein R2811_15165 [Flavobacteriales bacterium]
MSDVHGEQLIFASDSSFKNGYIVDAMLCTDLQSFDDWKQRSEEIRQYNALNQKGLHYKELRPGMDDWPALWPTLKSASMMRGVAVVVRTPPEMSQANDQIVKSLIQLGMNTGRHNWKVSEYVKMVGLASLVGAIAGAIPQDIRSVRWVSDSDPMFNHADQLLDIKEAVEHALELNDKKSVREIEIRTKHKPQPDQWAFDLVNVLDLYAGAVGDILFESEVDKDISRSLWSPGENERRNMKIANIGGWFLQDNYNPLRRYTFDFGPIQREGEMLKHSVACVTGASFDSDRRLT